MTHHLKIIAVALAFLAACANLSASADYPTIVRMTGGMGEFDIQLLDTTTPKTTANFLGYVQRGDFSNSIIHRSVPGFILQGGGFRLRTNEIVPVPTLAPVTNEPVFSNVRGTVAMAKLGGNPHSATSQWFINLSDENADNLDEQNGGFTVFGVVLGNGMVVADEIAALPTYNATKNLGGAFGELPLRNPSLDVDSLVLFSNVRRLAAGTQVFPFDFTARNEGFAAGFADYPPNYDPTQYKLQSSRTNLPANLGGKPALFISGVNRSDDLWMYWKRKVTGLLPNTVYEATFDLELASAAAAGMAGVGGAPGESVFLKAGASTAEPITVIGQEGWLRMNVDKGNQSKPGIAASQLGHAAKPDDGTDNYAIIRRDNRSSRLLATTATDGSLWLFFGSDSGFEGLTSLYYTKFTAVLEPVLKVQNITFAQPASPQVYAPNKTFRLSATSTSGLPVRFESSDTNVATVSSNVVTIKGAGVVEITAKQGGNASYSAAADVQRTVTITKSPQTIASFTTISAQVYAPNKTVTVTTVPAATSRLPVVLSVKSGPARIVGNVVTLNGAGTVVLAANQAGNGNFHKASEVTTSFAVTRQNVGAALVLSNTNHVFDGTAKGVTVSTTPPNLATVVTYAGSTNRQTNAGAYAVVATISNANYQGSKSGSMVIAKAAQRISFAAPVVPVFSNNATFPLVASNSSGLPVRFVSANPAVVTVLGNVATIKAAGTVVLTATNSGNRNFNAAGARQTVTVTKQ
jgi:cyclophilin family peptidyl-prolyl cis-trans isomerase